MVAAPTAVVTGVETHRRLRQSVCIIICDSGAEPGDALTHQVEGAITVYHYAWIYVLARGEFLRVPKHWLEVFHLQDADCAMHCMHARKGRMRKSPPLEQHGAQPICLQACLVLLAQLITIVLNFDRHCLVFPQHKR